MGEKNQFRNNFIWNILGTGVNAFNSLFFLITVTRINGAEKAGIFSIAFSTACIFFVIGIYAGRIYQVTEPDKNISNKDYIVNRIITVIIMNIVVVLFCVFRKYEFYKTLIFILLTFYKSIEAFCEVIYGVLQKNEKLEVVGKSLFIKSFISVMCFVLIDFFTKNMILSIISIIVIWLLMLFIYDFRKSSSYINYSRMVNWNNVLKIFRLGFTTFAITFLGLYIINAPKYAIDTYLQSNLQTVFGIVVMPATILSLVAQFLIHPYLNEILKSYKENDLKRLKKMLLKLVLSLISVGIVSSILAYLFGVQILGLIYGIDLVPYRTGLIMIIVAATLYTIGIIYSSVLTTVRETFSQFIIYMVISVFALVISNIFTKVFNLNGAFWAYLATMTLYFVLYTIYTNVKLNKIFSKKKNNELPIISS